MATALAKPAFHGAPSGTAEEKAGVLSFMRAGHEPLEEGKALNAEGTAVRAGRNDLIAACRAPAHPGVGIRAPTSRANYAKRLGG